MRLKQVDAREREDKRKAALSGQSVVTVVKESEIPALREQADSLSYELWGARVRRREADAAAAEARYPLVVARQHQLRQAMSEAEEQFKAAEEALTRARREFDSAEDPFRARQRARDLRQGAARLKERGPE